MPYKDILLNPTAYPGAKHPKYVEYTHEGKRLLAWGRVRGGHGLVLSEIAYLEEDDTPEDGNTYMRLPWLDQPPINSVRFIKE